MNESLAIAAEQVGRALHDGQTRWNGDDYFTHCERVALRSTNYYSQALGYLHDVKEDCGVDDADLRWYLTPLVDEKVSLDDIESLLKDLDLLNSNGLTYGKYIERLVTSNRYAPMKVKLYDLEDNCSDLDPGQRLQKYQLAHAWISYVLRPAGWVD
jgi:(p)ppGpp synthase/HD superfamily hydrolase